MKKSEIIKGMMNLLDRPERWAKGILHEDRWGEPKWCLIGAMFQVANGHWGWSGVNAETMALAKDLQRMACDRGFDRYRYDPFAPIADYNNDDSTEYEDVMLFLKEALYEAEIEEKREAIRENLNAETESELYAMELMLQEIKGADRGTV